MIFDNIAFAILLFSAIFSLFATLQAVNDGQLEKFEKVIPAYYLCASVLISFVWASAYYALFFDYEIKYALIITGIAIFAFIKAAFLLVFAAKKTHLSIFKASIGLLLPASLYVLVAYLVSERLVLAHLLLRSIFIALLAFVFELSLKSLLRNILQIGGRNV